MKKPRCFEVEFENILNNWPGHVTKRRHLASRQNRLRLCLQFRIIKRASEWPKRTHIGLFLRLRQAGLQNASNVIFTRKQRNLLDNSPHSWEAQSRIWQASTAILTVYKQVFWYLNFAHHRTKEPLFRQPINHQTWINGQLTRRTNKPPPHVKGKVRQTKHMVDCNDVICSW